MTTNFPVLALATLTCLSSPAVFAHDTPGERHEHEHEAFFLVEDHYEHVYSSMPPINPYDYFLDLQAMDANGNGSLSRREIKHYTGCGCTTVARDNLLREFRVTDVNKDGQLSKKELGNWLVLD